MKKPRRQTKPVEPVSSLHEPVDYPDGRDEAYVVKHFLGLSRERVQRMFEESGIEFSDSYSEAPERHSVSVTMSKISAVWEEA